MDGIDIGKLEVAILDVLRHSFSGVKLMQVRVSPDFDYEGDQILRVDVVFEGQPKDLDAGALASAVRTIRPTLDQESVDLFPLMSFIAADDIKASANG